MPDDFNIYRIFALVLIEHGADPEIMRFLADARAEYHTIKGMARTLVGTPNK